MHASTITMMDEIDRLRCHRSRRSLRSYHLHQAQSTRNRSPRLQSIPEHDRQDFGTEKHTCAVQLSPRHVIPPSTLPPLFPRTCSASSSSFLENDDDETPFELVNRERRKYGMIPFRLSRTLNRLASQQASKMAAEGAVHHSVSTINELQLLLAAVDVAENIQRGDSITKMHAETLGQLDCINRSNVISVYFSEFGYGLATGRDGKLYCCQLFRS
jgi:hypothetical protein